MVLLICKCQDKSRKRNKVFHIVSCEVEHNTQRGYLAWGSFFNYVDKTRYWQVGNVNRMQIFLFNSKKIPSQTSTVGRQVVLILGTIWSTQLKNDPLAWSRGKSSHHEIHISLALNQLPRGARPTFTICVLCCKKYITHEQNV